MKRAIFVSWKRSSNVSKNMDFISNLRSVNSCLVGLSFWATSSAKMVSSLHLLRWKPLSMPQYQRMCNNSAPSWASQTTTESSSRTYPPYYSLSMLYSKPRRSGTGQQTAIKHSGRLNSKSSQQRCPHTTTPRNLSPWRLTHQHMASGLLYHTPSLMDLNIRLLLLHAHFPLASVIMLNWKRRLYH